MAVAFVVSEHPSAIRSEQCNEPIEQKETERKRKEKSGVDNSLR